MQTSYDIIIIGTGAGGGTIAHNLAVNPSLTIIANAIRVRDYLKTII